MSIIWQHDASDEVFAPYSEMRAESVIVGGIRRQDPSKMRPTEHDDMIEALTSDRTDQAFYIAVLPW
jgi:hypothetical protein